MKLSLTYRRSVSVLLALLIVFVSNLNGQKFELKTFDKPIPGVVLDKMKVRPAEGMNSPDEDIQQPTLQRIGDKNSSLPSDDGENKVVESKNNYYSSYSSGEFNSPEGPKSKTQLPQSFVINNSKEELVHSSGTTKLKIKVGADKSGEKSSGSLYIGSGQVDYVIPDLTWLCYEMWNTTSIPSDAYVTSIDYRLRVGYDTDPATFFAGDYEIWLSSAAHGSCSDYLCVYDNLGGRTDGGYDDDAEDDADIYLNWRTTTAFYGESPSQHWFAKVKDVYSGDHGLINYVEMYVNWEAPDVTLPNLTASYIPSGWDAPIVASSVTGTHTSGPSLQEGQNTYIDWAIYNGGATIPSTTRFYTYLYLDGSYLHGWYTDGLSSGYYAYVQDYATVISGGNHTLSISADVTGVVTESNESDNYYEKTFYWTPTSTLPNLIANYTPSGWDYPIVASSVSGTHTVGPNLKAGQTTYIDWAFVNRDADIGNDFHLDLFVDDVWVNWWTVSGAYMDYYYYINDYQYVFTAGDHEICEIVDWYNDVPESNENDNVYCITYHFDGNPDIDVQPTSITINQSKSMGIDSAGTDLTNFKPIQPIDDKYIVMRIKDKRDPNNEIVGVVVPGIPPRDHREPFAVPNKSAVTLSNMPAFSWSFGCSATSAAMIAGYYDNTGFPNMYAGPTNGGVMPMNNSSWGTEVINGETRAHCPLSATSDGIDGRSTRGHVEDYWVAYLSSASDPYITNGWNQHTWGDCTADYMGTSQSAWHNVDGSTMFYYSGNGAPLNDYTDSEGSGYKDGCHGFRKFIESRGYTVTSNYTQLIYGYSGNTQGFTYDQFKSEINAGRPVLIQIQGHTMVGYGYDNASSTIYIHDTWDYSDHTMTWGGSYSGMQQWGVSVFVLEGGAPPSENSFVINNLGTANLSVTSITDNKDWLSTSGAPSTPFTIAAGGSQNVSVAVNWGTVGSTTQIGTITLASNDPDEPSVTVQVTAVPTCTPPTPPTSVSASPTTICSGSSTTLQYSGGSGTTFKWYSGSCGGTAVGTGNNLSVSPTSTTTYYGRWESSCGNSTCGSVTVTVNPLPTAPTSVTATNTSICSGSSTTLQYSGGSGTTFKWYSGSCGGTLVGTGNNLSVFPTSNTTYYGRWENGCGNSTCGSVAITVNALPVAPTSVTATNTSICSGSSTTLQYSGGSGTTFKWYSGSCGGTLVGTGNNLSLSPTSNTTYYGRWENSCGNSSCGSVTITINASPVAPTSVSASITSICSGSSTTLQYSGGSGTTFKWYSGSCGGTPVGTGNNLSVFPTSNTTYYGRWENSCGNSTCGSVTITLIAAPATPSLQLPDNGAACQSLSLTCSWNAATDASNYQIQVDDNNNFSSPVVDQSEISSTQYFVSGLSESTTYYWRVRAANSCGAFGSWSSVRSFTTSADIPGEPSLTNPTNGSNCQDVTLSLQWTPGSNTINSQLQVDDNDDFTSPLFDQDNLSGSSQEISGLSLGVVYYWRVRGLNTCSAYGNWTPVWSFSTGSAVNESPLLYYPGNGDVDVPVQVTLTWSEVEYADEYQLQVDEELNFSSVSIDIPGITSTSHEVDALAYNQVYYWRVKASSDCGSSSDWSAVWNFSTIDYGTGINDVEADSYGLGQNFPNPFTITTQVNFKIPVAQDVIFEIFDMQGNLLGSYSQFYKAGPNSITFNFDNPLNKGAYFYRMKTADYTSTRIFLVK
jgi:hypothetical protein